MKKQRKNKAKGYQYGKIKLHTSKYLENRNCNLYYLQALRMRERFIRDVPVIFLCKKKRKKERKKERTKERKKKKKKEKEKEKE